MFEKRMKKEKASRRIPEEKAATLDEVRAAIENLMPEQLLRLKKYARQRIRGLGRASMGRDHKDLLQEAITATLDPDRRRWNKGAVDFVGHLIGAMRSIADD
jgi:hypothetical protein